MIKKGKRERGTAGLRRRRTGERHYAPFDIWWDEWSWRGSRYGLGDRTQGMDAIKGKKPHSNKPSWGREKKSSEPKYGEREPTRKLNINLKKKRRLEDSGKRGSQTN